MVFDSVTIGIPALPFVMKYEDWGDILYRIDRVSVIGGGTASMMVETVTDERPTS